MPQSRSEVRSSIAILAAKHLGVPLDEINEGTAVPYRALSEYVSGMPYRDGITLGEVLDRLALDQSR